MLVSLHPSALDMDRRRLPVGARARLRQYTNPQRSVARSRRLLRRFRVAPIGGSFAFGALRLLEAVGTAGR